MPKTLYLSDLDGTLLGSDQRITYRSAHIINRLTADGLLFSCATARSRFSSCRALEGLELRLPMIVYNGTFIQRCDTGEVLCGHYIAREKAVSIINQYISCGILPIVYSFIGGREHFSFVPGKSCDSLLEFAATREGDPRYRATDTDGLKEGDIFYITAMGNEDVLSRVHNRLCCDPSLSCLFYKDIYTGERWLEVMPAAATKANAALELKKLLGCERLVCFGDAENDIPMFRVADECYAIEGAAAELRSIATGVIGSNDEDAVALWLEQHAKNDL